MVYRDIAYQTFTTLHNDRRVVDGADLVAAASGHVGGVAGAAECSTGMDADILRRRRPDVGAASVHRSLDYWRFQAGDVGLHHGTDLAVAVGSAVGEDQRTSQSFNVILCRF